MMERDEGVVILIEMEECCVTAVNHGQGSSEAWVARAGGGFEEGIVLCNVEQESTCGRSLLPFQRYDDVVKLDVADARRDC